MNSNFSNDAIGHIVSNLGPNYTVRVNKAGNITVKHKDGKEYWTLYAQKNGRYLWRHFEPSGYYCYPLNMKNRNKLDEYLYDYGNGTVSRYLCYNFRRHAEFDTVNDAVKYFVGYLEKYRNGKVY